MTQALRYAEKNHNTLNLGKTISITHTYNTSYGLKVVLNHTDRAKRVLLNFAFYPENKN